MGASSIEYVAVTAILAAAVLIPILSVIHEKLTGVAALQASSLSLTSPPPPAPPPPPPPKAKDEDSGWGGFFKGALDLVKTAVVELTPISDVVTLLDPNASALDKALAAGGLLTSIIPAGGPAARLALKGAAKALHTARNTEHAVGVARGAEHAAEELAEANKARDARKLDDGPPKGDEPDGPKKKNENEKKEEELAKKQCFAAGTLVFTASGDRPIETIRPGDLVWSRNEWTGQLALKAVKRTFLSTSPVLQLTISSNARIESLTVTPKHPFWIEGKGWTGAAQIGASDSLWSPRGELSLNARSEQASWTTVYNFEVEDFHTYFVGELHAWVHNKCRAEPKCFNRSPKGMDNFSPRREYDGSKVANDSRFVKKQDEDGVDYWEPNEELQRDLLKSEEDRQLKAQQDELNGMSVDEYLANLQRWDDTKAARRAAGEEANGRPEDDAKIRAKERKRSRDALVDHYLMQEGVSRKTATKAQKSRAAAAAQQDLDGTNALHKLDGVAGGNGTMHGMGNGETNQNLGRQWSQRVPELQQWAEEQQAQGLGSKMMNVELKYCP